jgi:hypothetical protein
MDAADRAKLHEKAQEQAVAMRNDARLKDEQARRDSNMMDALYTVEDAIKTRQHYQRTTSRIDGRKVWQPTTEEVQAAHALNECILGAYATSAGVTYG